MSSTLDFRSYYNGLLEKLYCRYSGPRDEDRKKVLWGTSCVLWGLLRRFAGVVMSRRCGWWVRSLWRVRRVHDAWGLVTWHVRHMLCQELDAAGSPLVHLCRKTPRPLHWVLMPQLRLSGRTAEPVQIYFITTTSAWNQFIKFCTIPVLLYSVL